MEILLSCFPSMVPSLENLQHVWLSWLLKYFCFEYFSVIQGWFLWAVGRNMPHLLTQLYSISICYGVSAVLDCRSLWICRWWLFCTHLQHGLSCSNTHVQLRVPLLCGSGRCSFFGTSPDCFQTNTVISQLSRLQSRLRLFLTDPYADVAR